MRKLLILAAVSVLAALPAGEAIAKKKAAHQHVEGALALPHPSTEGCVYRTQRMLFGALGNAVNGVIGYTFEVDPKTAGKPFKLEVSDGAGVDISFYAEVNNASDPTSAPSNLPFETAGPGGESGEVPPGFPYAFVCMTEGTQASFTYTAGSGVK